MRKFDANNNTKSYLEPMDILFFLTIFFSIICGYTILDSLSRVLFTIIVFIKRFKLLPKCVNTYFILEIIFIAYCYYQVKSGIAVNNLVASDKISTLIVSLIYYVAIYLYSIKIDKINKLLSLFINASFGGLLVVMLSNIKNLFNGRFGSNIEGGISLLGIKIGDINSTFIGQIAGIALFFSVMIYWKQKRKMSIIYFVFFTFAIVISGTRKMLIMVPITMFLITFILEENKKSLKKIVKALIAVVVVYLSYLIIINIPIFYNSIGYRLANVIDFFKEGSTDEASLNTRMRLIEKGKMAYEQRKIFGWGLDNFRYVINNGGYYAHNNFIEILVSGGLIGFIIYYLKYLYILITLFITRAKKIDVNKTYINGFIILILTLIILEYWQVTYFYRLFMTPFIIVLSVCKLESVKNKK